MNETKILILIYSNLFKVPNPPSFIAEECTTDAKTSTIILSWQHQQQQPKIKGSSSSVQGFLLEVDDGTHEGHFKEVYCGVETMCQINGLVANSIYNARVKAFNQAGFSDYSQIISVAASPSTCYLLLSPEPIPHLISLFHIFSTL
jgi:tripartite motif-containing protein 9/67